jgi:hypothetical protein
MKRKAELRGKMFKLHGQQWQKREVVLLGKQIERTSGRWHNLVYQVSLMRYYGSDNL